MTFYIDTMEKVTSYAGKQIGTTVNKTEIEIGLRRKELTLHYRRNTTDYIYL